MLSAAAHNCGRNMTSPSPITFFPCYFLQRPSVGADTDPLLDKGHHKLLGFDISLSVLARIRVSGTIRLFSCLGALSHQGF
jgi:hypothetical protein